MKAYQDLTGQNFGLWQVLGRVPSKVTTSFKCRCDCGVISIVQSQHLRTGKSKSCGCAKTGGPVQHGRSKTPEYQVWVQMKARCFNKSKPNFHHYGGRGITVCAEWTESFERFLADMGDRPSSRHSLDRIDNNAGYSPENCRWALPSVQGNNRRCNRRLDYDGKSLTIAEWADCAPIRISQNTLFYRVFKKKWSVERALTTPVAAQIGKNC